MRRSLDCRFVLGDFQGRRTLQLLYVYAQVRRSLDCRFVLRDFQWRHTLQQLSTVNCQLSTVNCYK
ncbi:MAG: hypothetical protein JGK01_27765 [Microcoleus sp. PH2017_03_ELD_O_A]|uniref:hypothetical protein n=1 Tax=unclassified Microcoleus TaxID=2642155 RepID=UPI001D9032C9|nr:MULTISPECIES: hypothetical protein [unclassified Microcoleus]MCC3445391.1 hypothetical protein [Microcoleus sp. PH2017_03_ELD_O_A]MCC3510595.1 hypothetical protein [Microcoleus sp. PH2017_17_BER_D_A]MCC3549179.1 hypothetical protein [Microcoleus sp. PH2017_24_DOB_U_A]